METLGRAVPAAEYLADDAQAKEFLQYMDRFPEFAFDTESTGKDLIWKDRAVFVSLAAGERRACLPIVLMPVFKPIFEDPKKLKVGGNIKFDMHMIRNARVGIQMVGPYADVITMSVRENSARSQHGVKYLGSDGLYAPTDPRYVKYPDFEELMGQLAERAGVRSKKISKKDYLFFLMDPAFRSEVSNYASMDAWVTLQAFYELRSRLQRVPSLVLPNLWDLYLKLESPLTQVLYDYETGGFPIDVERLSSIRGPIDRDIEKLVGELVQMVGEPINPNSTQQVSALVYDKLGYPPIKYTKGGKSGNRKPAVDEGVLRILAAKKDKNQRIFEKILQCRALVKVKGTNIDGYIKLLDPLGRIHTTYNQGGAETGRISSSRPNLQNVPSRPDTYGIRKAFRAPKGWSVLDFDFDQIEMKIMAALSGDKNMIDIINQGLDIHSKTAAMAKGWRYEDVQEAKMLKDAKQPLTDLQKEMMEERSRAKTIGFGIIFEASARRVASEIGCSEEEGAALQERWFQQFPRVKRYIDRVHRFVQSTGYVTSILGWRRYLPAGFLEEGDLPEYHLRDPEFGHAMRAAVNMTIQGSAADCMKIVQIRVHNDQRLRDLGFVPLAVVHDEVFGLVPNEAKEEALKRCLELAKNPLEEYGIKLPVDITASGGLGPSWGEAKD